MKKMKFIRKLLAFVAIFAIIGSLCISASAVTIPPDNNILDGTQIIFTVAPADSTPVSYTGYFGHNPAGEYNPLLLGDTSQSFSTFPEGSKYNLTIIFPNGVSFYDQNLVLKFYGGSPDPYPFDFILNGSGIAHCSSLSGNIVKPVSLGADGDSVLTVWGSELSSEYGLIVNSIEFNYDYDEHTSKNAMHDLILALRGAFDASNSPSGRTGFYFIYTPRYFSSFNYGWQLGFPHGVTTANAQFDSTIAQARLDSYEKGYNVGYSDGKVAASDDYNFNDLLLGVAGVPLGFISSMFNFEIMGVNIAGVVFTIITLVVIAVLVKIFI